MKKKLFRLMETFEQLNIDELRHAFIMLMEAFWEELSRSEERSRADTEMVLQFRKMKESLERALLENATLKTANLELTQLLLLRNGDIFGRSTERTEDIIDIVCSGTDDTDPVSEDNPDRDPSSETGAGDPPSGAGDSPSGAGNAGNDAGPAAEGSGKENKKEKNKKGNPGKKKKGKKEKDLSKFPQKTEFQLDVAMLNALHGEGNWRIRCWELHRVLENIPCTKYVRNVYTPVISVGLEHSLVRIPMEGQLLPRSLATPSLVAEIMYRKFVLDIPCYRQEADFFRDDVPLSRQTMTNWIIRFALDLLGPVYDYLAQLLRNCGYNQCDETIIQVILDGRKAGSKSYMWVHTLSELFPGAPIILFFFELTRGTDHLRDFYLKNGYTGFLTSDAYISYEVLEKESAGTEGDTPLIKGTGCFMHARRRYVYAMRALGVMHLTPEQLLELPEYKGQRLIDEIYAEDTPLKQLSAEERLKGRQEKVRPKVDAYFEYLKSLDPDDPSYSAKLRDAICYSLNQEARLRRFLDDPNIPIDNGFAERCIKPFTLVRKNSLFSYSVDGAIAMAIISSMVETAKANNAHPYYYLMYLLEKMPSHMEEADHDFLPSMTPWSEEYRQYEIMKKQEFIGAVSDHEVVQAPKAPGKKDCVDTAA